MTVEIYPPIADYALIADCHSGALVSKDGSIDWCTFHRFEARPVFGRILDWAKAGFFRIAPLDDDYEVDSALPAGNERPRDDVRHARRDARADRLLRLPGLGPLTRTTS